MRRLILFLMVLLTGALSTASASFSAQVVEQEKIATVATKIATGGVYYFGSTRLEGPLSVQQQADKLFIVDHRGQRYPLFVAPPLDSLQLLIADNAQRMSGDENTQLSVQHEGLTNEVHQTVYDQYHHGASEDEVVSEAAELYRQSALVQSVSQVQPGHSFVVQWKTYPPFPETVSYSFDAAVNPIEEAAHEAELLAKELRMGCLVVVGWGGMQHIVPPSDVAEFEHDLSLLKSGKSSATMNNPELTKLFTQPVSVQEVLQRANAQER